MQGQMDLLDTEKLIAARKLIGVQNEEKTNEGEHTFPKEMDKSIKEKVNAPN